MGITSHTPDYSGVKFEVHEAVTRKVVSLKAHVAPIEAMTIVGIETHGGASAVKTDVVGANKGAITLSGTGVVAGYKIGRYTIECIEPYVAAGPVPAVFQVTDPDGDVLPALTAGVEYNHGGVHVTKASGTADAAGDQAFLDVSEEAGSGKYVPLDPEAENGSEIPAGILPERKLANAADEPVIVINGGPTVVSRQRLVYGTNDPETIAAIDAGLLANCNITVINGEII